MLVPFLGLILGILLVRDAAKEPRGEHPTAPMGGTAYGQQPGALLWAGRSDRSSGLGGGAALLAQLTPLNSVSARQDHDSHHLRERFGLAAGEPWRLRLRLEGEGDTGAEPGTGMLVSGDALQILGDTLLVALPIGMQSDNDPLATLMRPGQRTLRHGQTADFFLWGTRPAGDVHVSGLGDEVGPLRLTPVADFTEDLVWSSSGELGALERQW